MQNQQSPSLEPQSSTPPDQLPPTTTLSNPVPSKGKSVQKGLTGHGFLARTLITRRYNRKRVESGRVKKLVGSRVVSRSQRLIQRARDQLRSGLMDKAVEKLSPLKRPTPGLKIDYAYQSDTERELDDAKYKSGMVVLTRRRTRIVYVGASAIEQSRVLFLSPLRQVQTWTAQHEIEVNDKKQTLRRLVR